MNNNIKRTIWVEDITTADDDTVILYFGSRKSEKLNLSIIGNGNLISYDWFPRNGAVIKVGNIKKKSRPLLKMKFNLGDEETIVEIKKSDVKLFAYLGGSNLKRHIAKFIICCKSYGIKQALKTLMTFATAKQSNVDYDKLIQSENLSDIGPIENIKLQNYEIVNIKDGEQASEASESVINLNINTWYERTGKLPAVIYTDEDYYCKKGKKIYFYDPMLKPDFDSLLIHQKGYLDGPILLNKSVLNEKDDINAILMREGVKENVMHVPYPLFHRKHRSKGKTEDRAEQKIHYKSDNESSMVSIIIPNKDHIQDLRRCIDSLLKLNEYTDFEIIIIENNSEQKQTFDYYERLKEASGKIRIARYEGQFNYSAINNTGVRLALGEYVLLLNNDTEVISSDFIRQMLSLAKRKSTGAVGAKLLYPNGTIQHAGVYIGVNGIAGHVYKGYPADAVVNMNALNTVHEVSAVTGACMMIEKSKYEEVGGLNENLEVAFNDIDFCLRLQERGYHNVFTPHAVLTHYESISRGDDFAPDKWQRFRRETCYMEARWNRILTEGDPFYNRNLTCSGTDGTLKKPYEF